MLSLGWLRGRRPAAVSAALVGSALAAAAVAFAVPAGAATVPAQLTLAGIAGPNSPTGGSALDVQIGSSVSLSAASAPTAGLPQALSGALNGLPLQNIQVQVLASSVPGLPASFTLGACTNTPALTSAALNAGTFSLTYTVRSMNLLCTSGTQLNLDGNQLKQAGIALNAKNQYVVAINSVSNPQTRIGVQVPSVGAQPQLPGGVNLPQVNVPGVSVGVPVPNLPVQVPGGLPTGTSGQPTGGGTRTQYNLPQDQLNYPKINGGGCCGLTIGQGGGSGGSGVSGLSGGYTSLNPAGGGTGVTPNAAPARGNAVQAGANGAPVTGSATQDLAANKAPTGQTPVVLGIVAVLAFTLVAGSYARLALLRRG